MSAPEKFNLYAGLATLSEEVEALRSELQAMRALLNR